MFLNTGAGNRAAFFNDLRDSGQRIVAAFGAGGQRANETALAFKELTWPHREFFDADFTSSGDGISVACCDVGYSPEEVRRQFMTISLKDIVDVYGRRAIIAQNIRRWKSSGLGINSGARLRESIQRYILRRYAPGSLKASAQGDLDLFQNIPTCPELHILATPYHADHRSSALVFSRRHTPQASISHALMASCADFFHFQRQEIQTVVDGSFETLSLGDAGRVEPLPLVSILKDHIARGYNPKNLTVLGVIPTYDFTPLSHTAPILRHLAYAIKDSFRILITNQARYLAACGARVIILQPNMDFLSPFIPRSRNLTERFYGEINIEHFAVCYPWILEALDNLFTVAIESYFENARQHIILTHMDKSGSVKALSSDEL